MLYRKIKFIANDINVITDHIMKKKIIKIELQLRPTTLFFILSDGPLQLKFSPSGNVDGFDVSS